MPLIFEDYADDLAVRVAELSPSVVLEIAAGSGVVARAVAPRLATDASFVVTDLNQPMLDRARAVQPPDTRIEWRQADALALPFEDAMFDVVLCQFGVMFFPDRAAAYREVFRVLRQGGRFIFNTWDTIESNEFAEVVTEAAADLLPDDPPRFLPRTPHGYHDLDLIGSELTRAGFADHSTDKKTISSEAPGPEHPAIAYCKGTPLRNEIVERDPDGLDRVTTHAARVIADRYGPGHVAAPAQAFVINAVK